MEVRLMGGQRRVEGCEARDDMLHDNDLERTSRADSTVSIREHSNSLGA